MFKNSLKIEHCYPNLLPITRNVKHLHYTLSILCIQSNVYHVEQNHVMIVGEIKGVW